MYEVQQTELAFCQTDDLIQELLNRMSFVGILVHSEKEAVGMSRHKSFMMKTTPNLTQEQIIAILETAVSQLKK